MAILITTSGDNEEYIVVEDVKKTSFETKIDYNDDVISVPLYDVFIRYHRDADQRERFKNNDLSRFEMTVTDVIRVPVDTEALADPAKTVRENLITAGYNAIKTVFVNPQDV